MRKRKFTGGIVALCLALSVAGCGKTSDEKQAANYYQKELGLDKDEAEELAHELYGKDKDEEKPSVTEAPEEPKEIVVEPLSELLNSEWYEQKVQIYDMVFSNDDYMTEEDIRKIVAGSVYDFEITEDFDSDGEICLRNLMLDGKQVAQFWKSRRGYRSDSLKYGLIDDGYYYWIGYGSSYMENNWYDKESTEFEDFKTRDDVLAYLAEHGFIEVEESQATYASEFRSNSNNAIDDRYQIEFADTPHYCRKGAQSITFYRMHKLSETDQKIERYNRQGFFSGAHLNDVNSVTFEFNTDGTIASMSQRTTQFIVLGEHNY